MDALTTRKQAPLAVPVATDDLLQAFADWMRLDVAEGDASPETLRTYWSQVSCFLDWCEDEGIHPALATEDDVKDYRAELISEGYARATMAGKLNAVRRFYTMAQARGYRPDNPAQGVKPPRDLTDRAERVKWLPLAAVQQVLDAPDPSTTKGQRDRAILALLAVHGLRVAEVAGLGIEDLDTKAGTLSVLGKGRKRRTVGLVDLSKAALASWLEVRSDVVHLEERALFVSVRDRRGDGPGRAVGRRGIRKMVDGYLEALGLKREGVSCHALRHSFATLSRAAGAKLDAISRALGHSSVTTTQVYADIVDQAAENPARFLVGALGALEK
jgi:site-specific recombinase XerD